MADCRIYICVKRGEEMQFMLFSKRMETTTTTKKNDNQII